MATDAYCTKCRTKREINDSKEVTLANGRHALQGVCAICGTKLRRFVAEPAKEAAKSCGGPPMGPPGDERPAESGALEYALPLWCVSDGAHPQREGSIYDGV